MVNMRAADPPPSRRAAAVAIVGKSKAESLRKRYTAQEKAGLLPKAETPASLWQRKIDEVVSWLDEHNSETAGFEKELHDAINEAASIGLEVNEDNSSDLLRRLEREYENLRGLLTEDQPSKIALKLRQSGVDPNQAANYLSQAPKALQAVERKLALVRRIGELFHLVNLPTIINFRP